MAKFCTNCGKEIAEGVAFCTECGTPVSAEEPKSVQSEPVAEQEIKPEQPVYTAPAPVQKTQTAAQQPVYQAPAPQSEKSGIVSTGYFFGMMFVYAIPVLGWLVCIITALAAKNKSKKNFAKAVLIWLIIGLIFSIIGYFVIHWLGSTLAGYFNSAFGSGI